MPGTEQQWYPGPCGPGCSRHLLRPWGATAGLQAEECPDGSDDNNDGADNSLLLRVFIALSQGALLRKAGSASQMLPN